jgi:hypothetical protein
MGHQLCWRTRSRAWRNRSARLPRFQQSAVTSRACDGSHLTPRPHWSTLFNEDERGCLRGELPRRQAVVSGDLTVPAAYRSQDAIDFYLQPIPEGLWKNEVTLRSTRAARMYEPGIWVSRVSPTPLLTVVARDDKVTIADLALAAYERALEPIVRKAETSPPGSNSIKSPNT